MPIKQDGKLFRVLDASGRDTGKYAASYEKAEKIEAKLRSRGFYGEPEMTRARAVREGLMHPGQIDVADHLAMQAKGRSPKKSSPGDHPFRAPEVQRELDRKEIRRLSALDPMDQWGLLARRAQAAGLLEIDIQAASQTGADHAERGLGQRPPYSNTDPAGRVLREAYQHGYNSHVVFRAMQLDEDGL